MSDRMFRSTSFALLLAGALLLAIPAHAQYPGNIYTPEVHIGSLTTPSTVTVPPIEFIPGIPEPQPMADVPPASTELLALRHFDFLAAPTGGVEFLPQGSMYDDSISLGDYARELRAQKQRATPKAAPDATPNVSR